MLKKILFVLSLIPAATPVFAAESQPENSASAVESVSNSRQAKNSVQNYLFFPPEMIKAMSACSSYTGVIQNNSPYWNALKKSQITPPQETLKIIGIQKVDGEIKCRFLIGYSLKENTTHRDCLISNQQRQRLIQGMSDKSGKIYSDTVEITVQKYNDDGKLENTSKSQVVKGPLYQVTMAKIFSTSCKLTAETPEPVK